MQRIHYTKLAKHHRYLFIKVNTKIVLQHFPQVFPAGGVRHMSLAQVPYTAGKYSEGHLCDGPVVCLFSTREGKGGGRGRWWRIGGRRGRLALLRPAHDGAASDDFTEPTGAKWHLERADFSFKGALQKVLAASQAHGKGELP